MVTIERLRELFHVEGGKLIWRAMCGRAIAGGEAGTLRQDGYLQVQIAGKKLFVHRIIFAMTHGRWPDGEIDHINGIKIDNKPDNLREATRSENMRNTGKHRDNTSGVKGVCWDKSSEKWMAQIAVSGKNINLGRFDDLEIASLAYVSAAERLHGAFARTA